MTKTIPLKAVQDALMLAVVRSKRANMHLGRYAAFTSTPYTTSPAVRPCGVLRLNPSCT